MQRENAKKLRLIYGVLLGVITIAVGISYIVASADLYYSAGGGYGMYSRESVGQKLLPLMIPSILWIVAIVVGYVLSVLFPIMPMRGKKNDYSVLQKLSKRMPAGQSEEFLSIRRDYRKGELTRIIIWSVCAIVWLVSAIVSAVYLFNPAHFPNLDKNAEILRMLKAVFPWFGASFLLCCGAIVFESVYAKKALPQMKKLLALGRGAPLEEPNAFVKTKRAVFGFLNRENSMVVIRMSLLLIGTVFVVMGIFNGGMTDVLVKAINICTECIGLG